jgi:hypothetical protein
VVLLIAALVVGVLVSMANAVRPATRMREVAASATGVTTTGGAGAGAGAGAEGGGGGGVTGVGGTLPSSMIVTTCCEVAITVPSAALIVSVTVYSPPAGKR